MRVAQFTVDSSQLTVRNPRPEPTSRLHSENGERKTVNSRSLSARPLGANRFLIGVGDGDVNRGPPPQWRWPHIGEGRQ